jgi:hypothetical protein
VIAGLVGLGVAAGTLGALVGIGGGVVLVPALVLLFGFDFRIAVAISLVAVIATSTAAGSVYVATGQTNMRLGMTLEVATTVGGIAGGLLATVVPTTWLAFLMAGLLALTAVLLLRQRDQHGEADEAGNADHGGGGYEEAGRLAGGFVDERTGDLVGYEAQRLWLGSGLSALAGTVSGLLGVGGGFLKVPAMHLGMQVPVKVAAATSNFMIGVTALSSFAVYLARGYVHPYPAALVAVGVTGGSLLGTRLQGRSSPKVLQHVLAAVLALVAVQLAVRAVTGAFDGG